jgi:aspartate carbamoyltransferase regulatory subunit
MDTNKRKELKVSAIRNGTVIDHIPAANTFQVIKILGLEESENQIYIGNHLESKKYGTKGIIKISQKYFKKDEISKIALVAPSATLIEIKDYEVTNKSKVETPSYIEKIVKCFNPKCVTNNQHIETRFRVITDHHGKMKLKCHYCEKTMGQDNIEFL